MVDLKDSFKKSGNSLESFEEACRELTESTSYITVNPYDFTFLSSIGKKEDEEGNARLQFRVLTPENLYEYALAGTNIPLGATKETPDNKALLLETEHYSGIAASVDGKLYYVSSSAIPTLGLRAKVGGTRISIKSLYRDMYLADGIFGRDDPVVMVVREEKKGAETHKKVFAFLTERMEYIPMTTLPDVVKQFMGHFGTLGSLQVKNWSMDHQYTDIYLEFPEAAEDFSKVYKLPDRIVPGLMLRSSDTGNSAFTVYGTYRKDKSDTAIIFSEFKRWHTGKIQAEDIKKAVDEEVLRDIRQLPERLATLIGIPIEADKIPGIVKSAFTQMGLRKSMVLGKKRAQELEEALVAAIDPEEIFTAYDMAMLFLGLADHVTGLDRRRKTELSKLLALAPYIDYTKEERVGVSPDLFKEGEALAEAI